MITYWFILGCTAMLCVLQSVRLARVAARMKRQQIEMDAAMERLAALSAHSAEHVQSMIKLADSNVNLHEIVSRLHDQQGAIIEVIPRCTEPDDVYGNANQPPPLRYAPPLGPS